ncbi:MAG: DNA-binding transcriptional LysR family regulator [Gammaproteobacteria bacterium]|jgi:DNA-binding transcriptional LysR family regulator
MIHGSASAAAEHLYITQPAVSRLLSDLESFVGFCLFERQGRGLTPTSDGRRLYEAVERVYLGLDAIQDAATAIREGSSGTLRVGTLPVYAGGLLAEQTGCFLKNHPGIRIELDSADRDDLLAGLLTQRFDIVISTLPVGQKGIDEIKLGEREAVCILHPDHPMAREHKIMLSEISEMPFIGLTGSNPFHQVINQVVKMAGGKINEIAAARTQRAVGLMVGAGAGISIVDPDVCSYFEPEFLAVRPLEPSIQWQYGILVPSRCSLSVAAQKFIDHLKQAMQP